jgi:hypothetical protein
VSSIVEQRGRFYAWVQTSNGAERRPVVLGLTNDKVIEIKDGIKEGESVLLNPRAVVAEARDDAPAGSAADGKPGEASPGAQGLGAEAAPGSPAGGEGGSSKKSKRGGGGGDFFKRFDANSDGKIGREEAPERMQANFDALDANKDGAIDRAEAAAMRRAAGQGDGGQSPGGAPGAERQP